MLLTEIKGLDLRKCSLGLSDKTGVGSKCQRPDALGI